MSKRRVYEFAKELGLENKDLVKKLQDAGLDVKSHSSAVEEEDVKKALSAATPKKPEMKRMPGMVVRKRVDLPPELHKEVEAVQESVSSSDTAVLELKVQPQETQNSASSPAVENLAPALHPAADLSPSIVEAPGHSEQLAYDKARAAVVPADLETVLSPAHSDAAALLPSSVLNSSVAETASSVVPEAQELPSVVVAENAVNSQKSPDSHPVSEVSVAPAPSTGAKVVRMIDRDKLISRIPPRRTFIPGQQSQAPRTGDRAPGGVNRGAPASTGTGFKPRVLGQPPRFEGAPSSTAAPRMGLTERRPESVSSDKDKKKTTKGGADDSRKDKFNKNAPHQRDGRAMFSQSRLRTRATARRAVESSTMPMKESKRVIHMKSDKMTVAELAQELSVKAVDIIRKLMALGSPATINQAIDTDTVTLISQEYGFRVESDVFDEDDILTGEEDRAEDLLPRPPVVTVMGHVDHGKTSLLDAIRSADVAAGEAGGITQHIGAYMVQTTHGQITFLDTPGHEAFTSMRARGAKVTDLVVLVVAADDGPMPQTIEAIRHAQAANVPIIVAVNKIDKPGAKPENIQQALTEFQLVPEEWGGDTMYVKTSALKRTGIEELLDAILLQSEVLELSANPNKLARGTIIEARLDKGMGPRATVIIQEGTLQVGQLIVVGASTGKVRALLNSQGEQVEEATPSMPVEVIGLDSVPNAGDQLFGVSEFEEAKQLIEHRREASRAQALGSKGNGKATLETLYAKLQGGDVAHKELRIILKADVQGSLEAIYDALSKVATSEVSVQVLHRAVGNISESDVLLAAASQAMIIGFNVRPDSKLRQLAERNRVELKLYDIIYNLLDEVKRAMSGLLAPTIQEKIMGRAEVRQVFHVTKIGTIAGCYVQEGKITRAARVRLLRDGVQVFDGKMTSLKRFKDDTKEVTQGFECGIMLDGYADIKNSDVIEAYEIQETSRDISSSPTTHKSSSSGRRSSVSV